MDRPPRARAGSRRAGRARTDRLRAVSRHESPAARRAPRRCSSRPTRSRRCSARSPGARRTGTGTPGSARRRPAGAILARLADGPRDADEVARALGPRSAELAASLLELELAGRCAATGRASRGRGPADRRRYVPAVTSERVQVVGGGLAGCEAAWQLARRGVPVRLFEMRPLRSSPAHSTDALAELVCSNSLRSDAPENAVGLLKEEMRRAGSLVLAAADANRVPAGSALAVDRVAFAREISERDRGRAGDRARARRGHRAAATGLAILATGPLTERRARGGDPARSAATRSTSTTRSRRSCTRDSSIST